MGRKSQAVGAAFESLIESHHTMALRQGIIAHIVHNQASSRVVGGRLIYDKPGVADYTGCLVGGGRCLAVEAKSVEGERLPKSRIEPLQEKHLNAIAEAGGLALLLVEFRVPGRLWRYAIEWAKVPWTVAKTAESLTAADASKAAGWEVAVLDCYLARFHKGDGKDRAPKRVYARQ